MNYVPNTIFIECDTGDQSDTIVKTKRRKQGGCGEIDVNTWPS